MKAWAAVALALSVLSTSASAVELRSFDSSEQRARFHELIEELRCLVCQNQSLADSDAELAQDLRQQVHEMLDAGRTNDEIVDFMVERYGSFVLYRPPLSGATLALWVGPFVLVGGGLVALFVHLRSRRAAALNPEGDAADTSQGNPGAASTAAGIVPSGPLSHAERERLDALVHGRNGEHAS